MSNRSTISHPPSPRRLSPPPRPRRRRAVTLVDVLVAIAIAVLLAATLAPILPRVRTDGGQVTSMNNLATLAGAHALYAADWEDRQVTWVIDEVGLLPQGNVCSNYLSTIGCPPQFVLGWDDNSVPTAWGYWLGCAGFPGNCGNWVVYEPCNFAPGNTYGSFRLPNSWAFHHYVNGRFYDETFYSPNDKVTYNGAFKYFDEPAGFTQIPPDGSGGIPSIWNSTYCLSPAAMWSPNVLSKNPFTGKYYTPPIDINDGYQSPTVSQCAYPELKTRMIEHNWTFDAPAPTNPAFTGNYTPYFFNQGSAATPIAMFYDGRIEILPTAQAVEDDLTVLLGGGPGLWSRDTPLGADGYYGAQAYDGTIVSHHILTIEGILGRDLLEALPPDGELAGGLAGGDHAPRGRSTAAAKLTATQRDRRRLKTIDPPGSDLDSPTSVTLQ